MYYCLVMTIAPDLLIQAIGGLGLFLLGMIILQEGLRTLAGNAMRRTLIHFTRSPLSGVATGATTTALLQSSSATTVAAVGFVGAGLMTFPAALGIIFGANVGTTITGWLVVLLGFKLKLGMLMLPVILFGAILKLFAGGRSAALGYALAGFGLIFVGIDFLQQGMSVFDGIISPAVLPPDTLIGRLQLVLLGIVATIITQSSSAGVATTLTLLFSSMINFHQAAALVIGMDIGTTVTAAMAAIGGTTGARRTGFSHVIYNLITGSFALLLITPYVFTWESLAPGQIQAQGEIALVAFHSLFNILGVIIVLPFTRQFAALLKTLVPDREPAWTVELDNSLLDTPRLAMDAAQAAITGILPVLLGHVYAILHEKTGQRTDLARLQQALDSIEAYLDSIHLDASKGSDHERLLALLHALDHMQRLHERCEEEEDRAITVRRMSLLAELHRKLTLAIDVILTDISNNDWRRSQQHATSARDTIESQREQLRAVIVTATAKGELSVPESTSRLQAIRWLLRVSQHIARITLHLEQAIQAAGKK
jgi:phosphate:Na+ symporter